MQTVALPGTSRTTTQLGFGCSGVLGRMGRRESLAVLECAFDAGIRHFDVAPLYGYGAAEACVGEFAARHPGQTTLTTKFGIDPPSRPGLLRPLRRAAEPLLRTFPGLRRGLARATASAVTAPRLPFTAERAQASLERSLAALRVSMIDLFLLHEVSSQDSIDPPLLTFLQDAEREGLIGSSGCASTSSQLAALQTAQPGLCRVLQSEWEPLQPSAAGSGAFLIHHRALAANFQPLHTALQRDKSLTQRWSAATGVDLAAPGVLASLVLKAALLTNPHGIVLFSSRSPAHVLSNVRTAQNDQLAETALRFYNLYRHEGPSVLGHSEPKYRRQGVRRTLS